MTRRIRLWAAAVLIAAASGLMAAVAVTATTGVNHTPAQVYLAGIAFNALDQGREDGRPGMCRAARPDPARRNFAVGLLCAHG
jgi:hypothetical protein